MWTKKSKEWSRPILKSNLQKWLKQGSSNPFGYSKRKLNIATNEVLDNFTILLEKWSHDLTIAKLLVSDFCNTLTANKNEFKFKFAEQLLHLSAEDRARTFTQMHVLFTKHADFELKISIIRLLLLMVNGDKETKYNEASKAIFINMILSVLPDLGPIEGHAETCFQALTVLLDDVDDNVKQSLLSAENQELLIKAYENHSSEDAAVIGAGTTLSILACSQNENQVPIKSKAVTCILESFKLGIDEMAVQEILCKGLASLSDDPSHCANIVKEGGVSLVFRSLCKFPESSKIVCSCLYFLENTAKESTEPNKASLLSEIFTAMVTHPSQPNVQEFACRNLSRLLEENPSVASKIGEDEDQLSIHNCVYAAMNIHIEDPYVFQASCGALHDLAVASSRLQQFLVARGCYLTIVDHMRENGNSAGIQEWGFRALRALCSENVLQEEVLIKYDLLTDIRKTLHVFPGNVGVLEEALSLLACLAADLDLVRRQCLLEQTHNRVVEIINSHKDAKPLLKICFETLAVFAASEEQEILSGVLSTVEDVMRRHKFVKDLQLTGCILIQLLASMAICENYLACANSVSLITEALINFPCDFEMQMEAAVALKVLAELENGLKAIVSLNAYENLFFAMRLKRFPSDILAAVAETLMIIGNEQENRDHMLQWAVVKGFWKEAKWLLGIGGNIDGTTQEKLNVIIAAEASNYKMMTFLLENGAAHAHEALKVSQSKEDSQMVGILLRHIGLERQDETLAWANLNIMELRSEYFTSSFIDETTGQQNAFQDEEWIGHFEVAAARRKQRFQSEHRQDLSSESIAEDDGSPTTSPVIIRHTRPRSSSGARLAFNQLDPRLEGSVENNEMFIRLESPSLRNSYPGHPESLLIQDRDCGCLLPSPTSNDPGTPKPYLLKRAASTLSSVFDSSSTEGSPLVANSKLNIKKSRSVDLRANSKIDSVPFILYADMSLNQISHFDVFSSSNPFVKPFFNGLVKLDLRGNNLAEFPIAVCTELTSLKQLYLAKNKLQDFPYDILENKMIEVLNVSENCIKCLIRSRMQSTLSLVKLEIDDNELSVLPEWLDDVFPALVTLSIARNRITSLTSKPLHLRQLKILNLASNKIETIPFSFFDHCCMLEKLDLTRNRLISLPTQSAKTFNRLSTVKLGHNQLKEQAPWYVPRFLLQLQNLICLDISHNKIAQIPAPSMWASHSIRDINFDYNRISKINLDGSASIWSNLTRLSLAHNRIERLPKFIGHLISLTSLDLSYNLITDIPDELGNLRNLIDLPLEGLSLKLHPAIREGTAQEICTFLYSKLKNAVPYLRMKLMVVGKENRGKTSLLRALQGIKQPANSSSTVGIEVKAWNLTIPKKYHPKNRQESSSKKTTFVLSTWDVAGQEDFHCTHQCFFSSRALYMAVFDASKGEEELKNLRPWLLNINASAPESQVIIVGTHADQINATDKGKFLLDLRNSLNKFMDKPGMPTFRGSAFVSCQPRSSAIDALREKIIDTVATCSFNAQVPIEQTVPMSYVQLEDLLVEEASKLMGAKQIPVITRRELFKIVQDNNLQLEKQELDQAAKFLHEVGVLMHYEDHNLKLSDCYFINPEWLSKMMAQVVTVKEINPFVNEQGVVLRKHLHILFRGELFPEAFIDSYLKKEKQKVKELLRNFHYVAELAYTIMPVNRTFMNRDICRILQKFEVVIPLSDEEFLIPSKLSEKRSGFTNRVTEHAIHSGGNLKRYYKFSYIPVGFWGRLISRLMLFHSPLQIEEEKTPLVEYWKDGIFRFWTGEKYFIVASLESDLNTIEIIIPVSQKGYELLGFLVDHIDALIEEWYPGLTITDPSGNLPVQRLVPCLICTNLGKDHRFTVDQCISRSYESDSIWCPSHEGEVDLKTLAPDVLFADIDGEYVLEEDEVETEKKEENFIDVGSFGAVYHAKCKGNKNVAVKVFSILGGHSPHRFLRQEVTILQHLRHPSLVSMVGVLLRPSRCLVMELASKGSLRKVLNCDRLSRGMQLRIASQVADGLAYLHDVNIIYRDLKPSNILIFSLSMGIPVNAKISDYGISQYITPQGLCEISGSPGYRAPEVEKGMYNKEADIFSLGVTLFELVTGGKKPFGESAAYKMNLDHPFHLKSPVSSLHSVGCPHWPDMQNIIFNCLSFTPDKRPTADTISKWLSCADTLCLRQEVGVCKGQTVECMAVHKSFTMEEESMELWIGSGDSTGHSQISWLSLVGGKNVSGCRGMILKDERVLCMCTIKDDLLLAGTQKGNVLVFDANTHEQLNSVTDLGDSVLCLCMCINADQDYLVLAGLANGQVAIFNGEVFRTSGEISPVSKMEILQNEEGGSDSCHPYPVTCMQIARRKCYCGVGGRIAIIDPKRCHTERLISNGGELNTIINQIAVFKFIWTSSKSSSIVNCLDANLGVRKGSFDCAKVLRERYPDIPNNDCRVLSLYHHKDALWIGCGGGHVIIIEPNSNFKVLAIISRHTSAVRSIIGASANDKGKPISLVLTGGIGFSERSQGVCNDEEDSGYVLIWEAELPQQCAYLDHIKKTRQKLAESRNNMNK